MASGDFWETRSCSDSVEVRSSGTCLDQAAYVEGMEGGGLALFVSPPPRTALSFSRNRHRVPAACQALIQVNETKTDPFPQRA